MLWSAWAFGCGQTTHVWTSLHAVEHLPAGSLRTLLEDPDVRGALVSGAMFPDGGYLPGNGHAYGEASHWEPFQDRVLTWVASEPTAPDRAQRVAFLLGLAAHGIGDQTYDAAYLLRVEAHDGVGQGSDTATDVHFAAVEGALPPNEHWVPYDDLVRLFGDAGIEVDRARLEFGMSTLDGAVSVVGFASTNPAALELNAAQAPWATSHLYSDQPGAPGCLGETIAAYWLAVDERLQGRDAPWVVSTFPANEGVAWPREGVDATLSVVFGRALQQASIEGRVTLVGPAGEVPVRAWMYYREASNVLDVEPLEPLQEDSDYVLSVLPGVVDLHGRVSTELFELPFSTRPPGVGPAPAPAAAACGCRSATASGVLWTGFLLPLVFCLRRARHGA